MTQANTPGSEGGSADHNAAAGTGRGRIDAKDDQAMTDTTQTSGRATAPAETDLGGAAETRGAAEDSGTADLSENTREVVVELLRQHQALLTELRWAYDQLERVQEVDIAALKQRVSELEQRSSSRKSARAASATATSKLRKRVEFTLHHPDKAVRVAGRKLARPFEQVARRAGFER
ncbi:hypothetical protein I2485_11670 [Nesterenkonia sp. E16_7]|uniref:hypothetical protein n=1 Tax=unclassified Nesterenkonia TaxID=2629769 RepID=UPI001A935B70|nr:MULTISPECIES: hypothetical protein [unclassified Nesterenkonia]MBO0596098.1 hypothetical protein [Nesterenkonia sp. E16_10]MBO0599299.1 hypothetical protein [Nesterenkonia sp. E16_7]